MSNTPQILNIKQFAQHIGSPVVTVRYWLRVGKCPVAPIPGMKPAKWRLADVTAWIEARDGDN